jgi:hypothetical protein
MEVRSWSLSRRQGITCFLHGREQFNQVMRDEMEETERQSRKANGNGSESMR